MPGDLAEGIGCLPSKCEALSSPVLPKKKYDISFLVKKS
jgi:hypothetical protein